MAALTGVSASASWASFRRAAYRAHSPLLGTRSADQADHGHHVRVLPILREDDRRFLPSTRSTVHAVDSAAPHSSRLPVRCRRPPNDVSVEHELVRMELDHTPVGAETCERVGEHGPPGRVPPEPRRDHPDCLAHRRLARRTAGLQQALDIGDGHAGLESGGTSGGTGSGDTRTTGTWARTAQTTPNSRAVSSAPWPRTSMASSGGAAQSSSGHIDPGRQCFAQPASAYDTGSPGSPRPARAGPGSRRRRTLLRSGERAWLTSRPVGQGRLRRLARVQGLHGEARSTPAPANPVR